MDASKPKISKRSGPSIVWIIPILTLLVGGWLIVKTLSEQGPTVTIGFKNAEAIEAGKTRIKYKNIDIGLVEDVRFDEDSKGVTVVATFNQGTDHFLRRNTRFWVVKPELGIRGVKALSTLLSGAYIEIEPGQGAKQKHFVGLEKAPVIKSDEVGSKIVLISDRLRSISTGSPVYYQGIDVGEILGHELANDSKSVYIYAFIQDPYDKLIRANTRFWNVSGIDISLDADGLVVKTESMKSIILGGISFETPETLEPATDEIDDLIFTLFDKHDSIKDTSYIRKIYFLAYFDSSVRGLNIGAPVEFKGIKIGSVKDVRLEFNSSDTSFRIPVLLEIEPGRIIDRSVDVINTESQSTIETLIEHGLRARLQTGSIITGQLFVELDMHPGTPIILSGTDGPYPELPTLPAPLEAIKQSFENILAKLNKVDIPRIGETFLETLEGMSSFVNSDEIQNSADDVAASLESLRIILANVEQSELGGAILKAKDALTKIESFLDQMGNTLGNVDNTLEDTQEILQPDAPLQYNLIKMSSELEETARAIRSLIEMMERDPQSLIFGKESKGE